MKWFIEGRISFEAFVEIMAFKFNEEDNEDVLRESYSLFVDSSGMVTFLNRYNT